MKQNTISVNEMWKNLWNIKKEISLYNKDEDLPPELNKRWGDSRNELVKHYYYLVQQVAVSMHRKIVNVQPDAMASMGVDGIYDAVDSFGCFDPATGEWGAKDPATGSTIKFETYASHRIRGSILDCMRKEDWVPRLVRSRSKKIISITEKFENENGRKPNNDELKSLLGVDDKEFETITSYSSVRKMINLNSPVNGSNDNKMTTSVESFEDKRIKHPLDSMINSELSSKIFGKGFTPLEKDIVHMYYFEGLVMKEIGERIGLSEARISQLLTNTINMIKKKITKSPEYFSEFIVKSRTKSRTMSCNMLPVITNKVIKQ